MFDGWVGLNLTFEIQKCEFMSIHECAKNVIHDKPVKTMVKFLSIYETKYQKEQELLNLTNKID